MDFCTSDKRRFFLEAKLTNIEVKFKKVLDEKNQLEKKLLQEENKSMLLNTEIERLRH